MPKKSQADSVASASAPLSPPVLRRFTISGGGVHPELAEEHPGLFLGSGTYEVEELAPGRWRLVMDEGPSEEEMPAPDAQLLAPAGLYDQDLNATAGEQMEAIMRHEIGQPTRPAADLPEGELSLPPVDTAPDTSTSPPDGATAQQPA